MHTDIASRIGALELNDRSLEMATLGPVQTHRFGCTMTEDAVLEDWRSAAGPTTGITCTPTLSATVCHLIDDGSLEATLPLVAGATRGGCYMSHPPQCRPQPGSLNDGLLEAAAQPLAGPSNGCGFSEPPMCHRLAGTV